MIVNQSAFAQYNLVVWTSDDENTIFNFEEKPVITIEGEYWKVTSNQKVIQYAAKDIVKITLEEVDDAQPNPTSVSLSQLAPLLRVVQRDAQQLLFNCKAKTAVKVFMATGQYVGSYRTDYEGSLVIDLANYALPYSSSLPSARPADTRLPSAWSAGTLCLQKRGGG
jgi:hypothetical protein